MTSPSFRELVKDGLTRQPDAVWLRQGLALLGWGEEIAIDPGTGADRFDRAWRELRISGSDLALASFTFDENAPGSIVLVPRVLARIDDQGLEFLRGSASELPEPLSGAAMPSGHLVDERPGTWVASVESALTAIRHQEIEKVVLSRKVMALMDGEIPIGLVLDALAESEPDSHTFLIRGFVGSSPELLCSLRDGMIRSISLAGSAELEDRAGSHPFESEKITLEHTLAADSVYDGLAHFCSVLHRSPSQVATYGEIRHLATAFEGVAHPGTSITDLIAALHPTAAVAGTPTKPALELIRELEGHDRGPYAGPVGWFDRNGEGEFAIALRCGRIDGASATLYSGAGIVEGSDPMLELDETAIKLRPMLGALGLT